MHRFWTFPLVLGAVGAVYPLVCVAQGWLCYAFFVGHINPLEAWGFWVSRGGSFEYSAGGMFAAGATIGLGAALLELRRFGRSDRNGVQAVWRLVGNVFWLGSYTLFVDASFTLLLKGVFKVAFLGPSNLRDSVPFIFILSYFAVNAGAILWAATRTALTDDVLSPRVFAAKWRQSNRAIE